MVNKQGQIYENKFFGLSIVLELTVKNWTHLENKVHEKPNLSKYLEIKVSLQILNDLKAQNFFLAWLIYH